MTRRDLLKSLPLTLGVGTLLTNPLEATANLVNFPEVFNRLKDEMVTSTLGDQAWYTYSMRWAAANKRVITAPLGVSVEDFATRKQYEIQQYGFPIILPKTVPYKNSKELVTYFVRLALESTDRHLLHLIEKGSFLVVSKQYKYYWGEVLTTTPHEQYESDDNMYINMYTAYAELPNRP